MTLFVVGALSLAIVAGLLWPTPNSEIATAPIGDESGSANNGSGGVDPGVEPESLGEEDNQQLLTGNDRLLTETYGLELPINAKARGYLSGKRGNWTVRVKGEVNGDLDEDQRFTVAHELAQINAVGSWDASGLPADGDFSWSDGYSQPPSPRSDLVRTNSYDSIVVVAGAACDGRDNYQLGAVSGKWLSFTGLRARPKLLVAMPKTIIPPANTRL